MKNYHALKLFFLLFIVCNQTLLATQKPVVIFAHGLDQRVSSFSEYLSAIFPSSEYQLLGENGPEVSPHIGFNHERLCLGQEADIQVMFNACNKALKQEAKQIIGFGYSKGAATWLNFLHRLHTSNDETSKLILSKLTAVIVFAPFADCYDFEMLSNGAGKLKPVLHNLRIGDPCGIIRRTAGPILQKFLLPEFDLNGQFPINSVKNLPPVPLLIIHSTGDGLVPVNHSRKLYVAGIESHKQNPLPLYYFEFDGGGHVDSMHANNEWHTVVESFLKNNLNSHYQPDPKTVAAQIKSSAPRFSLKECMQEFCNACKSKKLN